MSQQKTWFSQHVLPRLSLSLHYTAVCGDSANVERCILQTVENRLENERSLQFMCCGLVSVDGTTWWRGLSCWDLISWTPVPPNPPPPLVSSILTHGGHSSLSMCSQGLSSTHHSTEPAVWAVRSSSTALRWALHPPMSPFSTSPFPFQAHSIVHGEVISQLINRILTNAASYISHYICKNSLFLVLPLLTPSPLAIFPPSPPFLSPQLSSLR